MCHSLTASYVRARHRVDKNIPVCSFYEVHVYLFYHFVITLLILKL